MDDITVEVCGENGAWYKVCKLFYPIPTKIKKNEKKNSRKQKKIDSDRNWVQQ